MSLTLADILGNIIEEDASNSINSYDVDMKIKYAITNRKYISLYYDDKKGAMIGSKGNPKGFRRIIPYCYGSRKGRPALRAFHAYKTNTKRGPLKWKFFYIDNVKNLRVYENWPSFTQRDLPQNFNPNGDKHMDEIYAIVDFGYESPVSKAKSEFERQNPKGSVKNVNSLSNLKQYQNPTTQFKNNKTNYGAVKTNLDKRDREMTDNNREQYWKDYEKAEQEAQQNNSGPVKSYDNEYDVNDVDFNENNFITNTNRR
jgi:hypothetical protein